MSSPSKLQEAQAKDKKLNPASPKEGKSGAGAAAKTKTSSIASSAKGKSLASGLKKKLKNKNGGTSKVSTSPKGAKPKADGKGEGGDEPSAGAPKADKVQVEQAAPTPGPEPAPPPKPKLTGEVTIRYNHYSEKMPIEQTEGKADGAVLAANIVEALALDFAFQGSFCTHLNKSSRLPPTDRLWFQPESVSVCACEERSDDDHTSNSNPCSRFARRRV